MEKNELFKKVWIHDESDLPKEYGIYNVSWDNKGIESLKYDPDSDEGADEYTWLKKVQWYLQPIEQPKGNWTGTCGDLKQYVTNLLYKAYDFAEDVKSKEFDVWVEEMIDGIDGYFKSIEQPSQPKENEYPVIAIDNIDVETVKRWFQLYMGFDDDSKMRHDIRAMARASHLNKHLKWDDEQPEQRQSAEEIKCKSCGESIS